MRPCKLSQNKYYCMALIAVGLISLAFGIVWSRALPEEAHNLSMLSGMLSGMGSALAFLGAYWRIRLKVVPAEKLRLSQIEQNDERNVQIRRMAYTAASNAATGIFAVLAFLLLWMDYRVPALLAIGALYLHFIIFLIAVRVAGRRI